MSAYGTDTVTRSAPAGRRPPKPSLQIHLFMKNPSECVRRVSPDKRLEAQADKLLELCEIIGWTCELHAAGIALKQLESVREMAKVTKRQRGRRRKRGCRVRESMSLPGHRCRIEGACKACGEERRPGVPPRQTWQVCLVELVDTGLPEVLLVSVTWKRV